jgi:predicted DNA binding CopG/RHH family protein
MKKRIPTFKTDAEAERFVATADLSEYDLSGLRPTRFEFEKKTAQLNMRLPASLLEAVKKRAVARGIPYTRFIREAVETALTGPEKPG